MKELKKDTDFTQKRNIYNTLLHMDPERPAIHTNEIILINPEDDRLQD